MDDLESDFSAIHRVDDIYALDSVIFLRRAFRITAYAGVLQSRAQSEAEENEGPTTSRAYASDVKVIEPNPIAFTVAGLGDLAGAFATEDVTDA